MAVFKSIKIPNGQQDAAYLSNLKRGLYGKGFKFKKNYEGAQLVSATKYWWDGYWLNIPFYGDLWVPGGYFFAYVYTYPDYIINKKAITKEEARGKGFYDDSLDDLLGGSEEKLGG